MFVDIVSFTQFINMEGSETALFDATKAVDSLQETIRSHGGIIDKTLGDGILCFFGYLDRAPSLNILRWRRSSAQMRFEKSADGLIERTDKSISFAFNIGINTDLVYVGNMGTIERPDLTFIRLEGVILLRQTGAILRAVQGDAR